MIPCLSPTAQGPPSPDYGYSSQQPRPFSSGARGGGGNGSSSPYSSSPNLAGMGSDKRWGAGLSDRPASLGPPGSPVSPGLADPSGRGLSSSEAAAGEGALGAWQVLWQIGGVQQQLVFEATQDT